MAVGDTGTSLYPPDMSSYDYDLFVKKGTTSRVLLRHNRNLNQCFKPVPAGQRQRWTSWLYTTPSTHVAKSDRDGRQLYWRNVTYDLLTIKPGTSDLNVAITFYPTLVYIKIMSLVFFYIQQVKCVTVAFFSLSLS